ncbi:hypothetical protein [Dankookia sp. P2]|uniref:hypothetical protein n=1 Tax=Dankookia sp. P2 TaxID=3423955 RepID=UPI003D67642E
MRQGRFNLCRNQRVVGSSRDGGYAEMMTARGTALVSIPEELEAETDAVQRVMSGEVRFRIVLVTRENAHAPE